MPGLAAFGLRLGYGGWGLGAGGWGLGAYTYSGAGAGKWGGSFFYLPPHTPSQLHPAACALPSADNVLSPYPQADNSSLRGTFTLCAHTKRKHLRKAVDSVQALAAAAAAADSLPRVSGAA